MHRVSTILPFLLFLFQSSLLSSQLTQKDSIDRYLGQIEKLIQEKDSYKEEFLDTVYLHSKLKHAKGEDKVAILLKLYTSQIYRSIDRASCYNDKALALSKTLSLKKGMLAAKYNQAYLMFMQGNFDGSRNLTKEVQKVAGYGSYPEIHSDFTALMSVIHTEKGEYDMALETALGLLEWAERSQNEYMLMKAHSALSHYYLRAEKYQKALTHCLKGLHYIIALKKTHYFYPKMDEIARMTAKLGDRKGALDTYGFYIAMEKKMMPVGSYIQSVVYMNMADIYMCNGNHKEAQRYLSRAMAMNSQNNYRFRIPRALIVQAELYLQQGDTLNAIKNYESSIEAAEDIDAFDVMKSNSAILENLYTDIGEVEKAHDYQLIFKSIRDSLFTHEKEQKIIILETQRDIREVSQRREILELQNHAQRERYKAVIAILLLLVFLSMLSAFSYLKVKGKNKLLTQRAIQLAKVYWTLSEKLKDTENSGKEEGETEDVIPVNKVSTVMDEDTKDIILAKLEKLEAERFYIDPNCNLYQLSDRLKTNPKYLSHVINQTKNLNFNSYINEMRIKYLLAKLAGDAKFRNSKLSYIAVSVGFNNLNTFNAAFKKRHGILPSHFIKELNTSSASSN
tara:strand:- start:5472 stop:7337 length:1866 start_codon:yes stop_codon:yes gene_type:complete